MKNRRQWLVIAAVIMAVGVGAFAAIQFFYSPVTVRLEITGSPAMNIVGTCTADGGEVNFGPHKGPNTINAHGHSISYVIENIAEGGPMKVEVFVDGESRGSITADRGYTVVRGIVQNGKVSQKAEQRKKN